MTHFSRLTSEMGNFFSSHEKQNDDSSDSDTEDQLQARTTVSESELEIKKEEERQRIARDESDKFLISGAAAVAAGAMGLAVGGSVPVLAGGLVGAGLVPTAIGASVTKKREKVKWLQ